MNKTQALILGLLAEDKEVITYRKNLNKITGSVTATILLQQIIYWAKKSQGEPFYKFRAECHHERYKPGDSWTEELGFSLAEFDTALSKIGTKITKGISKFDALKGETPQHLVIYWTDSSRVTWYMLNIDLLGKFTMSIYLENADSQFTSGVENLQLSESETTTKNTTEKKAVSCRNILTDPLTDIVTLSGKTSEVTESNPDDQWLRFRDSALADFDELSGAWAKTSQARATQKEEIVGGVGKRENFDREQWRRSIRESIAHNVGPGNIARFWEVYDCGGSYDTYLEKKYPNTNGTNGHQNKVTRTADGGMYV